MLKVPFFSIAKTYSVNERMFRAAIEDALCEPDLSRSSCTRQFENWIEEFTGARHAVAVGNATDALTIVLRASGIGPGDEVIVPTYSFVASATSVCHAGATPVFVDIESNFYSIDVSKIEQAITPRTRAIMPVHLFSQMADMRGVMDVAEKHNLLVIEDSAEGIGMWWGNQHAGCIGHAGVISFFPSKTLGALGDAGMILTNNEDIAASCRVLRSLGRSDDCSESYARSGYDSKMDAIQASLLLARGRLFPEEVKRRKEIADQYSRHLEQLRPYVEPPRIARYPVEVQGVWYVYLIQCDDRNELAYFLASEGIGTETYYPTPFHLQPCFAHLGYHLGQFPVAEKACSRALGLPMYPDLSNSEVETVCSAIAYFYKERPRS